VGVFERFVGMRFLRPRRKQILLSIITLISTVGVAVGVATLIVVISVITGFQDFLQEKTMEAYSHIIILSFTSQIDKYEELVEKIESYEGVKAAAPFLYTEVMVTFGKDVGGVVLRGVEPGSFGRVSTLDDNMVEGSLDSLGQMHKTTIDETDLEEQLPGIILGSELAFEILHVYIGDVVNVVTPFGEVTPMGYAPKMRRFFVSGIFKMNLTEFDAKFAFIPKKEAQSFLGVGDSVTGIEVTMHDLMTAPEASAQMSLDLGWPYKVSDWTKMHGPLFAAIKLEKLVMFLILCIIIFVASLNIFSTLYLMVMDKKKSIAILRSMGASGQAIRRIFMVEGIFIGCVGSTIGLVLGSGLCLAQIHLKLVSIDPSVYLIDTLPMKLEWQNFALITGAALGMALLATYIPAVIASKIDPVKVLRYE